VSENAYAKSGVDVEAGYEVVSRIKKHVAKTERLGVLGALGGFGGSFDLSVLDVKEPVLISGTDGVGTKLMLAIQADKHDTIGIDCVAMCVNDIIAAGAEPLYFLDYIATGKNIPEKSNFLGMNGFDAISGKSNFDISEWMFLEILRWLSFRGGDIALLVKTSVARKIMAHAEREKIPAANSQIIRIDAKKL